MKRSFSTANSSTDGARIFYPVRFHIQERRRTLKIKYWPLIRQFPSSTLPLFFPKRRVSRSGRKLQIPFPGIASDTNLRDSGISVRRRAGRIVMAGLLGFPTFNHFRLALFLSNKGLKRYLSVYHRSAFRFISSFWIRNSTSFSCDCISTYDKYSFYLSLCVYARRVMTISLGTLTEGFSLKMRQWWQASASVHHVGLKWKSRR